MLENRLPVTIAAFIALALNGLTYAFVGTSLPAIQVHLAIGIDQAAALMAFFQTGVTVFSLIGGILSDCMRRERILMGGCLLLCVGALCLGVDSSYALNLLVVWIMGAGMGCVLSGSNTLLVSLYPVRKGTILNIHHVFFGLGSLSGPVIMGYLIMRGDQWRQGFIAESVLLAALGAFFFLCGGKLPTASTRAVLGSRLGSLFRDRDFILILAVCALAVGTQVSILLLGVTFLVQAKQSTLPVAGGALSCFAVFMVLGRLLCSRLTLSMRHATIILVLLWLQLMTLLPAWQGNGWFAIAALALSGLTFSGIYPTALALTGLLFPRVQGSALGILSTTSGLGTVVLCWLTGYVADRTDMDTGFVVLIGACVGALLMFQFKYGTLRRRESSL